MTVLTLSRRRGADDPYSAKVPYLAGTIIGVREWHGDGKLRPVTSYTSGFEWKSDGSATEAECSCGHEAPQPGCECGLYAYHPWSQLGQGVIERTGRSGRSATGLVAAWGRIEVHRDGFRAQYARPVAFIRGDEPEPHGHLDVLAESCGAAIVRSSEVNSWLEERAGALPESAVGRLLSLGSLHDRFSIRSFNWGRLEDAMESPLKIIGYAIYGLLMFTSVAVQFLWWGFLAYMLVAAFTGFDPIGIQSATAPDPAHNSVPAERGWHPPMNR